MNLQQLQINLCSLIKSRLVPGNENDEYLHKVASSKNLQLIKKIALWWRRIQIESCCLLTGNLSKMTGSFEKELLNFFNEQNYSAFREEIYIQFLEYLVSKNNGTLKKSVAAFELAVIKLNKGEKIETSILWQYEPYSVIDGLLKNDLDIYKLKRGIYRVEISYRNREELFMVEDLTEALSN